MIRRLLFAIVTVAVTALGADYAAAADATPAARQPNVIFILADDLGYGDLGITFQHSRTGSQSQFDTPNLDAMARNGTWLRQHYTCAPVCAPARGSLLSGLNQGNCNIRNNQFDKAIANNHTLGTVMTTAGYDTIAIGKWGLQGEEPATPGHPNKHGFDDFFGYLAHMSGHVYYHDAEHPLEENGRNITAQYADVYDTDLFTARAKQYIAAHETGTGAKKPFFMYLAYTAPHNNQGLPGNAYPSGTGLHGGLQWPLTPTPQTKDKWYEPAFEHAMYAPTPGAVPVPWKPRMKRYVTVIRRLDQCVGDLLQTLRDLHIDNNTLVVFTSDNGPSNEGTDPRWFDSWGPFDGFKRDVWEGGMREPTIAWWPGHVPAGKISDLPSSFCDWMPTLASAAGVTPPANTDGVSLLPTLLGQPGQRPIPYVYSEYFMPDPRRPGSLLKEIDTRKDVTGRGQMQWLRMDDLTAVRVEIKSATDPLRLYDVMNDPHEDHELSRDPKYAGEMEKFTKLMASVRRPLDDAKRPYDDQPLPADAAPTTAGGLKADWYAGQWPWVPDTNTLAPVKTTQPKDFSLADAPSGPFAAQFTGAITVPTAGPYTFFVTSDGGAELWLHHAHLIDDDFARTGKTASATVNLEAGTHPLRLVYRHDNGTADLKVEIAGPGMERQAVRADALHLPR
jgi:arylsulfatase A-like enzyme